MSPKDLKEWLMRTGLSVHDIAYALKIHPQTIYRFMQGKRVQRSTVAAIERFVESYIQREALNPARS